MYSNLSFQTSFAFLIVALFSSRASFCEEHGHDEEDIVHLSEVALKAADLEIQVAGPGALLKTIEAPGEIMLNADRVAHITPRAAGVAEKILKSAGAVVSEGEVLAVLQSPELGNAKMDYFSMKVGFELAQTNLSREQTIHDNTEKLFDLLNKGPELAEIEKVLKGTAIGENKTRLLNAFAALRLANSSWTRAQKLKADHLVSEANFEQAVKDLESTRADFNGTSEEIQFVHESKLLQAQRATRLAEVAFKNSERHLHILGLSDTQVSLLEKEKDSDVAKYELKAPFAGTILERHISLGEQVATDRDCFTLADLSSVWCDLRIYVSQISKVKVGQKVMLKIAGEEQSVEGKISVVSPQINERNRAASIRATLVNRSHILRPGLFVTGALVIEEKNVPVAVPAKAIQRIGNKSMVFVEVNDEGEFQAKPVVVGDSDGTLVEIRSGLTPGAKIVVRNSFVLKAELGKGEGGHDD